MKKAFTMIELIFVIVIIGILSAVAIPKLGSTVEQAYMVKGKNTLSIVRSAIATERQKGILKGSFGNISIYNAAGRVFTKFTDVNGSRILDHDLDDCVTTGCWHTTNDVTYTFYRDAGNCTYALVANRFVDQTVGGCTDLED
ncbi:MAG TPA: type II secretion system protein [Epsilonproteobacteria bacterium]|nr:type II secretion system protein [Campylobacterota bacterium]